MQADSITGLVLAGGKSKRMGADKGLMQWHGKEQRYYMADLLQTLCTQVFISCRPEQEAGIDAPYQALPDAYQGLGPVGGILTAFQRFPHTPLLVTACDLPLLDYSTLTYLLLNRNPATLATTFASPHDGLPEPLITIWEPASRAVLQAFAEKGISCPRKVLLNNSITVLQPLHPDALLNANTPADADKVYQLLRTSINAPHVN